MKLFNPKIVISDEITAGKNPSSFQNPIAARPWEWAKYASIKTMVVNNAKSLSIRVAETLYILVNIRNFMRKLDNIYI